MRVAAPLLFIKRYGKKSHMPMRWLLSLSGLLVLASCASAPSAPAVDVAAEEAKIRDLEANQVKNFAAKDIDKIIAFYADDATLMVAGDPVRKGKDEIKKGLGAMVADPSLNMQFSPQRVEIGKSGDVAFTQGSYQLTISDPKSKKPITDKGSYVTGYKKQADGSWRAVSDIAVSALPVGGPS